MTSQKSLRTRVNMKDFLRSFGSGWIFPAVALLVLLLAMVNPVAMEISKNLGEPERAAAISFFFHPNGFVFDYTLLLWGMVLCGFILAVRQFSFLMSKKSVNVYLSMGISRMALYGNRILSSLLMLLLAVLVPTTILYGINLTAFGASQHLLQVYLYANATLFVSALAGFSIGAFASMISGNVVESTLVGAMVSFVPIMLYNYFTEELITKYLKGYVSASAYQTVVKDSQLSPFTFVDSIAANNGESGLNYFESRVTPEKLLTLTNTVEEGKKVVPTELLIDRNFWIPMLVWTLLSALFLLLGAVFLKLRKAEHAKSFGSFAVSRGIGTAAIITAVSIFVSGVWDNTALHGLPQNSAALWAVLLLVSLVCVFLVQLLWTRKLKKAVHSLIPFAALFAVFSIGFFALTTGGFGAYNRPIQLEAVESVSMDIRIDPVYYMNRPQYTREVIAGTSEADKKMVLQQMALLQKEEKPRSKTPPLKEVTFVIHLKNGKYVIREYPIYKEETLKTHLKETIESAYFDEVLETMLLQKNFDEKTGKKISQYKGKLRHDFAEEEKTNMAGQVLEDVAMTESYSWHVVPLNGFIKTQLGTFINEGITDEAFYQALYNDLSKMTFESLLQNTKTPKGVLSMHMGSSLDNYDKNRVVMGWHGRPTTWDVSAGLVDQDYFEAALEFPLFPEMQETLQYLSKNGIEMEPAMPNAISEIFYVDEKFSFEALVNAFGKKYDASTKQYFKMYESETVSPRPFFLHDDPANIADKAMSQYDWLQYMHKETGHALQSVPKEKFSDVQNSMVINFYQYGDDGRFIYIVYETGVMQIAYIPQAKLSVLH